MGKKQKFEIPWWDDWYNADCIERRDMVEKLPIVQEMIGLCGIKDKKFTKKHKLQSVSMLMNSFFEDLADYMEIRKRLEDKKK